MRERQREARRQSGEREQERQDRVLSMQPLPEMNQSCNLLALRIVASAEEVDNMSINKCEAISSCLGNGRETDTEGYTNMQNNLAEP